MHAAPILHARRLRARPYVAAFAVRMWASAVTVAVGPLVGAHLWLRRLRVKAERDALATRCARRASPNFRRGWVRWVGWVGWVGGVGGV